MALQTRTITVELGARSYPIQIGLDLLSDAELLKQYLSSRQVMVITNQTIAPLYLKKISQALTGYFIQEIILPDGECYKNLESWARILDLLLAARFGRDCTLIALGGGVIGDLTGFAAACYQRGVALLQIPTTLLAQVDSSVGGKTGVNHAAGKNLIGAFYQPRAVIADLTTLNTLPARELSAGLAEVIKYGLIWDKNFFNWLEKNIALLRAGELELLAEVIQKSCLIKAQIVAQDEKETGLRALLNFGHTFGHAIETTLGYGTWLHGEAVGMGMIFAADLSMRLGWLNSSASMRISQIIAAAGLPTKLPSEITPTQILDAMTIDKKVLAGRVRFVLLTGLGTAQVTAEVAPELLHATLSAQLQAT